MLRVGCMLLCVVRCFAFCLMLVVLFVGDWMVVGGRWLSRVFVARCSLFVVS